MSSTVGGHLCNSLKCLGVTDMFCVPGDFTLPLLNHIHDKINVVGCTSELGAGYAADGYARTRGMGCVTVTYGVGALSALNAIAGSYAERLPILIVSGAPRSAFYHARQDPTNGFVEPFLHHTLAPFDGTPASLNRQMDMFRGVTVDQDRIDSPTGAAEKIDRLLMAALREQRPVYLEVCADMGPAALGDAEGEDLPLSIQYLDPRARPFQGFAELTMHTTSPCPTRDAIALVTRAVHSASKPLLLFGPHARATYLEKPGRKSLNPAAPGLISPLTVALAESEALEAKGAKVMVTTDGRGVFPETHRAFFGVWWSDRALSSRPECCDVIADADLILAVGTVFFDMNTLYYKQPEAFPKMIFLSVDGKLTIGSDVAARLGLSEAEARLGGVTVHKFLRGLTKSLNSAAMSDMDLDSTASSATASPVFTVSMDPSSVPTPPNGVAAAAAAAAGAAPEPPMPELSLSAAALCMGSSPLERHLFNGQGYLLNRSGEGNLSLALKTRYSEKSLRPSDVSMALSDFMTSCEDLIAETGDTFMIAHRVSPLKPGSSIFGQYQYTSIGWSVGAAIGVSCGLKAFGRRAVLAMGDGSFQVTGTELSTLVACGSNAIVLLCDNAGYQTEILVDDKYLSNIPRWDYSAFALSVANSSPKGRVQVHKARTGGDLASALFSARASPDSLVFIECTIDGRSDDLATFCSRISQSSNAKVVA